MGLVEVGGTEAKDEGRKGGSMLCLDGVAGKLGLVCLHVGGKEATDEGSKI